MTNCLDIALGQDYRTVKVVKNAAPTSKEPEKPQIIEAKQQNSKDGKNSEHLKLALSALAGIGIAAVLLCNPNEIKKVKKKGNEILQESKTLIDDALKTKEHAKMLQEGADKMIEKLSMEILEGNGDGILNKKNRIYSKAGENSNLIAEYRKHGPEVDIEKITITIKNKFRTKINCDSNKVKNIEFGIQNCGNRIAGQYDYGQISIFAKNVVKNGEVFIPKNKFIFNGDECTHIISTTAENVVNGLSPKEFIYKDGMLDAFIDSSVQDAQGKIIENGKIYKFENGVISIMRNLTKENKIFQNFQKIFLSISKNLK